MFGKKNIIIASIGAALLLSGCGSSSSSNTQTYKVTVKNITAGQTFSPPALIVQNSNTNFNTYTVGSPASVSLENLAEGGSPTSLLADAKAANVLYENSFASTLAPGASSSLTFTVDNGDLKFSLASMLIKTNDAFIGVNNTTLDSGDSKTINLNVYDTGTEGNDEASATVPGLGGVGFNAVRNDTNVITLHSGLVTLSDGLGTSGLSFSDKWDNPAAVLTIEKIH